MEKRTYRDIVVVSKTGDRFKFINVYSVGEWADNKLHIKYENMDNKKEMTATFFEAVGYFDL